MKVVVATIKNKQGIHVRPSGIIIGALESINSVVKLDSKGISLELQSVMDLLALGLQYKDELTISVEGKDEGEAADILLELFERVYDFPPR